ncbi:hypothetical protein KL925_003982 [Ogataea polymorpha]|nr:hypothetical protein KL937_003323 [Ogataea polymorpha]KAG7887775.1 hypothetical protein KL936_003793 [Ogataea polymorpha]KAG7891972.1 hypothetical protein KL908_003577 [Ogataea polymorpha]KAG7904445.1 hypothetical protein KL907_003321 [Ogataea polymorpha]KAG7925572.1 hypothetical protein KL925_003982 [Ogataea polymorpha]
MSDSESLMELEEEMDDYLGRYREQRMEELAREIEHAKRGKDAYQEVHDEGELMRKTVSTQTVVILFHNPEFQTCQIVDGALREIASRYYDTQFYKIKATEAPFLAVKLQIKVLPCIVIYRDGKEIQRVVGLESLIDGTDIGTFTTQRLEKYFLKCHVIRPRVLDTKQ